MKILNDEFSDYHIHSSTFSDGLATIEEIVKFAGEIGMKEIAITDHNDAMMKRPVELSANAKFSVDEYGFYPSGARYSLKRRQNVHNDVKVIFGVEGDVLNEEGDVCLEIQGQKPDFIILGLHKECYYSAPETTTIGLVRAIERFHEEIVCVCHSYEVGYFGEFIDIKKIVEVTNAYRIPLEFNAKSLQSRGLIRENLDYVLKHADQIYVNSDAHTLRDMKELRKSAFAYLRERGYL